MRSGSCPLCCFLRSQLLCFLQHSPSPAAPVYAARHVASTQNCGRCVAGPSPRLSRQRALRELIGLTSLTHSGEQQMDSNRRVLHKRKHRKSCFARRRRRRRREMGESTRIQFTSLMHTWNAQLTSRCAHYSLQHASQIAECCFCGAGQCRCCTTCDRWLWSGCCWRQWRRCTS
jgi:hypothetical protein